MTLDEMIARCLELAPDFKLDESVHVDPRFPGEGKPLISASCTIAGQPYALELIAHFGLTKERATHQVVEGCLRTLERRRGHGRGV